jgi:hypothetical protein
LPNHLICQVKPAEDSGKWDPQNMPGETAARKNSEAFMASLIVIALVITVTGVLTGGFFAISVAINRGYRVRSLIWQTPGRPAKNDRPLVGSSRRG